MVMLKKKKQQQKNQNDEPWMREAGQIVCFQSPFILRLLFCSKSHGLLVFIVKIEMSENPNCVVTSIQYIALG